ncbi:hypothetical protein FIBSPDRAFT_864235 [Athelia psychrophila]|uniref:Uncharacterized protein n=1 Tax=Athelia psychrophila TaxID=1759441 RepID=A0A166GRL3_9AGAM|nr:hypothetical protein FIBSPDRAFT_864235 [Fibularhizoctonia sp. CBS 109695]
MPKAHLACYSSRGRIWTSRDAQGVPVVSCKVFPVNESLPPTMGLGDETETKQESTHCPRRLHTDASDESPGSRSTPPGPPESSYILL